MIDNPLVSIIIDNYNYDRYLGEAIESALAQTYDRVEVIVVDDGSEDDSPQVIKGFGSRIIPILKSNGGQGSAFNAGFRASSGDVVIFLDADDILLLEAASRAVKALAEPGAVKVHWPLEVVDENGGRIGEIRPQGLLPEGDLRSRTIVHGPNSYAFSPTSGNAWTRAFLERVLPMPEEPFRISADAYLCDQASVTGIVRRVPERLSLYRVHGNNSYASLSFADRIAGYTTRFTVRCAALSRACANLGIDVDQAAWEERSWMLRTARSLSRIQRAVPDGCDFIFVDENLLGIDGYLGRRRCIPYTEREGKYWGIPTDDNGAIQELERLRRNGARFAVFAEPALWWLDHFTGLSNHLAHTYGCVLRDADLVIFDLEPRPVERHAADSDVRLPVRSGI